MLSLLLGLSLVLLLYVLELKSESSLPTTTLQTPADDRGSTRFLFVMYILSVLTAFITASLLFSVFDLIFGLLILLLSFGLLSWTTRVNPFYLRSMATTDDQFICTDGPYQRIRHPAYLAFCLGWLGLAWISCSLTGTVIIFVLILLGYIRRIRAEEQMMLDRFGVDYQQYIDESYRLIPYIY